VITTTLPQKSIVLDATVQKHLRTSKLKMKERLQNEMKEDESSKKMAKTISPPILFIENYSIFLKYP
jgi:hypothetical protein